MEDCLLLPSRPVARWRDADTALERAREDHGAVIARLGGDGLQLIVSRLEQMLRALHADVREVLHGRAAEFFETKAAQVFLAYVDAPGELGQAPRRRGRASHFLPE